jgi:hypothetical protein
MRFRDTAWALAIVVAGFACAAAASASPKTKHVDAHRSHFSGAGQRLGVNHADGRLRGRITSGKRSSQFVALVGDQGSGVGFYPLPWQYRAGAWRERQRRAMEASDAIHYAVASEAIGYDYLFPGGEGYGLTHHHGIFNPVDGYGTPFFAGYYGGAGEPGDDPGPFGRPYGN